MSESESEAERERTRPDADSPTLWVCETCGHELAVVVNGEAWFDGRVILRPGRIIVLCPDCGSANPWRCRSPG